MTKKEQEIIDKVKPGYIYSREMTPNPPRECDWIPNPFDALTMDELIYLREHEYLLEELKKLDKEYMEDD